MFCIFPAISLPRAFGGSTEKGLRHFSFPDVFSDFLKSRGMSALPKISHIPVSLLFIPVPPRGANEK